MAHLRETKIEIIRGDDVAVTLNFADADGEAIDVSSWTFSALMRTDPDATEVVGTFAFDTTDAVTGTVVAHLSRDETSLLVPDTEYHGTSKP